MSVSPRDYYEVLGVPRGADDGVQPMLLEHAREDEELAGERARSRHMTMSALVGKLIEDELSSLTMDEWLDEVHKLPSHDPIDIEALMDEVKDEIEGR